MKLNDQDAQVLATTFRDAGKSVGDFLYAGWNDLLPADRNNLGQMFVTLKNSASYLTTRAIGIDIDEHQASLADLSGAVREAEGAFQDIADANKAIVVTTALIALAAAIPTGKNETIATALQNLRQATSAQP